MIRNIFVKGVNYTAEYKNGASFPWRLTSVETGGYHGEVRWLEGKLFSATISPKDEDSIRQHLCWTPITF